MIGERVACLLSPDFSIEICLRTDLSPRYNPESPPPVVLTANDLDVAPIIAVNRQASLVGLSTDMTIAQAGTLCPNLIVKVRDMTREIEESNRIFKKLQSLSPFVEEAWPGKFFLDAAGLTLLYKNEAAFAERIITTVRPLDYPVKVGIAANKFIAEVAAGLSNTSSHTIVPAGHERTFLNKLSVTHLPLSTDTGALLYDLGLRTIGQLASFPANEMTRRFGPEGTALAQLARGDVNISGDIAAFFMPEPPEEELSNVVHLTYPIHRVDVIAAHVGQLLSPLFENLGKFSQGCSLITIRLELDNRTQQDVSVTVERPTLSIPVFLRQLSPDLEKLKLLSSVTGIKVTIPQVSRLLSEQLTLSSKADRAGDLSSELPGSDLIHDLQLCPAILPEEKFSLSPFSHQDKKKRSATGHGKPAESKHSGCYAVHDVSGLRLLQPPREIEVFAEDSQPLQVISAKHGRRSIQQYRGPWELSGGWWSVAFDRLYYEIQIGRQFYLIFFERSRARWFLQGIFD